MCGVYVAYSVNASDAMNDAVGDGFILCEGEEVAGLNRNMIFNSIPNKSSAVLGHQM